MHNNFSNSDFNWHVNCNAWFLFLCFMCYAASFQRRRHAYPHLLGPVFDLYHLVLDLDQGLVRCQVMTFTSFFCSVLPKIINECCVPF